MQMQVCSCKVLDTMDGACRLMSVALRCSHQASGAALGLLCRCGSVLQLDELLRS